jgi:hypothetical protein
MGRHCTICKHPDRDKLDAAIVEGAGSAGAIAGLYGVSKNNVLNHRKHIGAEMKAAHSERSTELREILKRCDKNAKLLSLHLKNKPREAIGLDWIRESRDLRGWLTFRVKALGKIAPVGDAPRREGDSFCVQFIAPDGKPAKIPLAVYRSLPAFKNGAEGAETGHLQDTDAVSASVHAALEGG